MNHVDRFCSTYQCLSSTLGANQLTKVDRPNHLDTMDDEGSQWHSNLGNRQQLRLEYMRFGLIIYSSTVGDDGIGGTMSLVKGSSQT